MLANYHTHTTRCKHAVGEDKAYIEEAIKGGMCVLGFSDHCPWVFKDEFISGTRMTPQQLDGYFSSLSNLKKEYSNEITIYIGFESEYIPELMEAQNKLLSGYPIDYMILGEHFVESEPNAVYTGLETSDENLLIKYVDTIIEGMDTGKYKYVAHPDLINFTGSQLIYEQQLTKLCKYLKENNLPIEINLLGIRDKRHYTSDRFLKIAEKVGNSAIIGCDAHFPEVLSSLKEQKLCCSIAEKYHLPIVDFLPDLGKK